MEKLRINLGTAYGLLLGQCTNYLRSRLKGQEKWETNSNEQDLLKLLKSVKSLLQNYDKDTEYHHVACHTLLHCFVIFCQEDSRNSEYKQRFKEQIRVLEAYNVGVLFGNIPGAKAREIALLGLNTKTKGNVEKSQIPDRGKYLATTFLLSSYRFQYWEMILSLKNYYAKQ